MKNEIHTFTCYNISISETMLFIKHTQNYQKLLNFELPAGKGLTSWLSFVIFNCIFVTFLSGILGQCIDS